MYIATIIHLKSSWAGDFLSSILISLRLFKSRVLEVEILFSQFEINFFFSSAILPLIVSSLYRFSSGDINPSNSFSWCPIYSVIFVKREILFGVFSSTIISRWLVSLWTDWCCRSIPVAYQPELMEVYLLGGETSFLWDNFGLEIFEGPFDVLDFLGCRVTFFAGIIEFYLHGWEE